MLTFKLTMLGSSLKLALNLSYRYRNMKLTTVSYVFLVDLVTSGSTALLVAVT